MTVFCSILQYFMDLVVFGGLSINFRLLPVYFRFTSGSFPVVFSTSAPFLVHFWSNFGPFLVIFGPFSVFGSLPDH